MHIDIPTASAIFAGLSAFVSVLTLRSWRGQMRAADNRRLAEDIATAAIELRNAFIQARSPWVDGWEVGQAVKRAESEGVDLSPNDQTGRDRWVYGGRQRKLLERLGSLEALSPRAEFQWGHDLAEEIEPLRNLYRRWVLAVESRLGPYREVPGHFGFKDKADRRAVFYADRDGTDSFSKEVAESCERVVERARDRHKV